MELVARQSEDRRHGLPVEFPLTDSQGLLVEKDRRRYPDRRRTGYGHVSLRAALYKTNGGTRNRLIAISIIVLINVLFLLLLYAVIMAFQN
jgi:hypothetical protein